LKIKVTCAEVNCPGMASLEKCLAQQPCPAKAKEIRLNKKQVKEEVKNEQKTRIPVDVRKRENS